MLASAARAAAVAAAGVVGARPGAHHERAAAHLLRHRAAVFCSSDLCASWLVLLFRHTQTKVPRKSSYHSCLDSSELED